MAPLIALGLRYRSTQPTLPPAALPGRPTEQGATGERHDGQRTGDGGSPSEQEDEGDKRAAPAGWTLRRGLRGQTLRV
jgi:hypothetical protein